MDANWARSLFTVWVFISFILVLYIVFNRRNKKTMMMQPAVFSIMTSKGRLKRTIKLSQSVITEQNNEHNIPIYQ